MARDLGAVLDGALVDVGEPPGSVRTLARAVGDKEAVQILSGMRSRPQRAAYESEDAHKAALTRWTSAQRRVQRSREVKPKGGTQSRGGALAFTGEQETRWRGIAEDRRLAAFTRNGGRMRITARVKVSTPDPRKVADERTRTMPATGPGVELTPRQMNDVLEAAEDGGPDDAEGMLIDVFSLGYGVGAGFFEFEEIIRIKLWPEHTTEPD